MTESLVVGLFSLLLALGIQRAFLGSIGSKLRAREQAFQFHSLRDSLQLFVAEGRVDPSSITYGFLITFLNFSIRNAGALKLREVLALAEKVKKTANQDDFLRVIEDIQKHDRGVQDLAQNCFLSVGNMLISNDPLVRWGVRTARTIASSSVAIRPLIELVDRVAASLLKIVTPTKVKAVREAQWYLDRSSQLSLCR